MKNTTGQKGFSSLFAILIVLGIVVIGSGAYFLIDQNAPVAPVSQQTPPPAISPTPLPPAPTSAGESPQIVPTPNTNSASPQPSPPTTKPIIQGRIIDIYPGGQTITIQTTTGKEEVVTFDGKPQLSTSIKQGAEVNIFGSYEKRSGIFLASSISALPKSSLTFQQSLSVVDSRKNSAKNVDASGMNLAFGECQDLPKPGYLVFVSPDGQILAPYFTSITAASYDIDGSLDTLQDALKSCQYITIPIMSRGLWTVKFVTLPGADMSTVFGFEPGLPVKTLAERDGKLWYFKIVKLDTLEKIENELAACDANCRSKSTHYIQEESFLFGTLGDQATQQKLFGRTGTPYILQGYKVGSREDFFGGKTCTHLVLNTNGSVSGSKLHLDDWEWGALRRAGVCERGIKDLGKDITAFHVVPN